MTNCDLCELEEKTRWYMETKELAVLNCKDCQVPMVVLNKHTMTPSEEELDRMHHALTVIADTIYGEDAYFIDKNQRAIPNHIHWHARPKS